MRRTIKCVLGIQVLFVGLKDYQQSERLDLYQSYAKKLLEVMPLLNSTYSLLMKIYCSLKSQDTRIAVFVHQIF